MLKKKNSSEWKPKIVTEEIPHKPPAATILSPKPVPSKQKEPQNQADLVRLALAAQKDDGPVKPETATIPAKLDSSSQLVSFRVP